MCDQLNFGHDGSLCLWETQEVRPKGHFYKYTKCLDFIRRPLNPLQVVEDAAKPVVLGKAVRWYGFFCKRDLSCERERKDGLEVSTS